MPVTLTLAAITAATTTGVLADKAVHAETYFSIGAALAVILGFFVVPVWRAFRTAQNERRSQVRLLNAIHDAIYGRAENREEGVSAVTGLVDRVATIEQTLQQGTPAMLRIEDKVDGFSNRLSSNEAAVAEARQLAGQAAAAASTAKDRLDFLNDRIWERFEGLTIRNEMLTGLMQEAGYEVGEIPPLDDAQ